MAGLSALGGHTEGRWYVCNDGWPLEPLDVLHLLLPNEGRSFAADENSTTSRIPCFQPCHFPFAHNELVPVDLVDSAAVFLLLCAIVTLAMIASRFIWNSVDPSFASIRPAHKQWYVIANMSKGLLAGCIGLSIRFWILVYFALGKDYFQSLEITRNALLHSATDVVALYMVPKLPTSTRIHHVIVIMLCLFISSMDLSVDGWRGLLGVCKMAFLYGICATVAFTVNIYLALRVVYPKSQWLQTLAKIALLSYLFACAVNWTVHLVWLGGVVWSLDISMWEIVYLLMVCLIVQDDIRLIKWLIKRSSPMAVDDRDKKD